MKAGVAAFFCGGLFALGLGVSGMTEPTKVIGFLDIFGAWDFSLAFVMAGAIAVHALFYRWIIRRPSPLFAPRFEVPQNQNIDAKLIGGAALFGIGWGMAGFCPGPAFVSLVSGKAAVLLFVVSMLFGMRLYRMMANY